MSEENFKYFRSYNETSAQLADKKFRLVLQIDFMGKS